MFRTVLLAVTLSFCSLIYELLLAKSFMLITDNVVVAQTVSVGLYLLGIGVGVFYQSRSKSTLAAFFRVELSLSALGMLIPFLTYSINIFAEVFLKSHVVNLTAAKFLFFSSIPLAIGFLTGREFMLLVYRGEEKSVNINIILASTYFGNLLGGLAFPLIMYEPLGLLGSCTLVSGLNILIAFLITHKKWTFSRGAALSLVSVSIAMVSLNQHSIAEKLKSVSYVDISTPDFSVSDLKNIWHYFKSESPKVEAYRSKYQDIDLVDYKGEGTTLFLNRKPQFSTTNYKSYHISMLEGFINLHGSVPAEVLILGGGDGILARYLLERGVEKIKIIDLDPFITKLARNHPVFLELNRGSLSNGKVTVVNGDAFSFMMKNEKKFEAVFIDFPLPTHLDLSKLYSAEFYAKVWQSLSINGSVIFDSPAKIEFNFSNKKYLSHSINLISSTLRASGVKNYFGFGPHEAFFYFTKQIKKIEFDYNKLPKNLPGYVLMNLIDLNTIAEIKSEIKENSIFKPVRFK